MLPPATTLAPATALYAAAAAAAIEAELVKAAHEVLVEAGVPMGGDGGAILQVAHPHLNAALLTICGAPAVGDPSRHHLVTALTKAASRCTNDVEWADVVAKILKRELCSKEYAAVNDGL